MSIIACVALWLGAVALGAVIYVPNSGILYSTPVVQWSRVAELIPQLGWSEIWSALGIYDAAFLISVAIASISLLSSARVHRLSAAYAAAAPLVLLFPVNVGGLLGVALAFVFPQPIDGEFLTDGWAQASVYGIWTAVAGLLAWRAMRSQRSATRGAALLPQA